ncbi:hypothetical protein DNHGIG_32390 [Collibacillus ludicampi]|uniref:DUF4258 domain-containing protein n=1 Tax=Collibacillus ludicampi TaxID=2771369 RepID=A0AAV4LIQ7_9BACL|nr:hypothetical protein [Collibacillus ludicampi]GIM47690.1 hypothetical protein DNHGIG_32390 [Collibacillus ludicampi]
MRIIWTNHAKKKLGDRHRENALEKAREIGTAFAEGDVEWIVPGEEVLAAGERMIVRPDREGWYIVTYLGSHPYPEGTDFAAVRRWERHQRRREMHKTPLNSRRRVSG